MRLWPFGKRQSAANRHPSSGARPHSHRGPRTHSYALRRANAHAYYGADSVVNQDTGVNASTSSYRCARYLTHRNSNAAYNDPTHADPTAGATIGTVARYHNRARKPLFAIRPRRLPLLAVR